MAAQLGKPVIIQEDPSLLTHMGSMKRSQCALPHNLYGNAYIALLQIVSGFRARSEIFGLHSRMSDIPPDLLCIARYGLGELSSRAHGWKLGFGAHDPGLLSHRTVTAVMYIIVYVQWNHWLSVDSDRTYSLQRSIF